MICDGTSDVRPFTPGHIRTPHQLLSRRDSGSR